MVGMERRQEQVQQDSFPSLVKLAEIEGRGRALIASQPLRSGQIVLRDSPILVYSALPLIPQIDTHSCYCDFCFTILAPPAQTQTCASSSVSVVSCPSCSHHLFCSPKCLSLALSSSHSPWVCQALAHLRECASLALHHPLERQVQARFLIAAYNLSLVAPHVFQILLTLQGQGSPGYVDATSAQFLHSLISSLCPPPAPAQPFSLGMTMDLLAKDKLNAFGLMEPFRNGQRSVRAYAIYPMASFFNHDCLPNACRFDYVDTTPDKKRNTDIVVRMIHDVPEGREICLSYFPVNENYSSRQKRLLEDYGFACDCDRCKVEANWSDNDGDDENVGTVEEMDEDSDEEMAASISGTENEEETDFPHAYFFVRYMCNQENCWGTLAPLPPSEGSVSNVMECNVCGNLKSEDSLSHG